MGDRDLESPDDNEGVADTVLVADGEAVGVSEAVPSLDKLPLVNDPAEIPRVDDGVIEGRPPDGVRNCVALPLPTDCVAESARVGPEHVVDKLDVKDDDAPPAVADGDVVIDALRPSCVPETDTDTDLGAVVEGVADRVDDGVTALWVPSSVPEFDLETDGVRDATLRDTPIVSLGVAVLDAVADRLPETKVVRLREMDDVEDTSCELLMLMDDVAEALSLVLFTSVADKVGVALTDVLLLSFSILRVTALSDTLADREREDDSAS